MTGLLSIRPVAVTDYLSLCELWSSTEGIGDVPGEEQFARFLQHNHELSQVALSQGVIVGAALASFDGIRGYIYRLATSKRARRSGVASRIVGEIERRLKKLGASRINIHVFAANESAMKFWSTRGFSPYDGLLTLSRQLT